MQLILTEEQGDFDTIGAMLGAYLLHPMGVLVLPEHFSASAEVFMGKYFHKLPFESASFFRNTYGDWLFPRFDGLLFGFDFLQSVQITRQLQSRNIDLDPFFASTILLGIYSIINHLNSFSADQAAHQVIPYLMLQGADEDFVQEWLSFSEGPTKASFPELVIEELNRKHCNSDSVSAGQHLLEQVLSNAARDCSLPIYLVGGVVRDLLLGKPARDLDFVVEGDAIRLAKSLQRKFGGAITTHNTFGTASWRYKGSLEKLLRSFPQYQDADVNNAPDSVDLITARSEWYPAAAQLPTVRPGRISLDLRRRDFTINTLALRLDTETPELLDACGGIGDLHEGVIRALHPLSFRDDPTRLFRAVRYEQRLGFQIEAETETWMRDSLHWVEGLSGDRLRHELNLILMEDDPENHFRRLDDLGILRTIHPEFHWDAHWTPILRMAMMDIPESAWELPVDCGNLKLRQFLGYAVWLAGHSEKTVTAVCRKLLFSTGQTQAFQGLERAIRNIEHLRNASNSIFVYALESLNMATLFAFHCLVQADSDIQRRILEYRDDLRHRTPGITGETLLQMGIPQGKIYREILDALRSAWLDEVIQTPRDEKKLLEKLLADRGFDTDG